MKRRDGPRRGWNRAALLVAAPLLAACAALTVNDVTTGRSKAYPDLKPLYVRLPPQELLGLALDVAREMPRWSECRRVDARRFHCIATTRSGFVDDVEVWTDPWGPAMSRLMVRSASRVGVGDLGMNARRIRAYLAAVQARLAGRRPTAPRPATPSPPPASP